MNSTNNDRQDGPLQRPVGLVPSASVIGGYKASTVRFDDGTACCTCTYNYSMSDADKTQLARRIAAALNLTRYLTVEQIESIRPNASGHRPDCREENSDG